MRYRHQQYSGTINLSFTHWRHFLVRVWRCHRRHHQEQPERLRSLLKLTTPLFTKTSDLYPSQGMTRRLLNCFNYRGVLQVLALYFSFRFSFFLFDGWRLTSTRRALVIMLLLKQFLYLFWTINHSTPVYSEFSTEYLQRQLINEKTNNARYSV